jgi:hypothetical protein
LQIFARIRNLTIEEKEDLLFIYKNTKLEELKIGCLLLLNEKEKAIELLNAQSDKVQEIFRTYPIWHFANEK